MKSLIRSTAAGVAALIMLAPAVSSAQSRPSGWVGVVITTGVGQATTSGAMVFNDYPVIESVDPGSPAERAGLQAGDVIISINSQDLRRNPVPMASLLVPGQSIAFRFRRNEAVRTLNLTVAERPAGSASRMVVSIIDGGPEDSRPVRLRREADINNRTGTIMPAITLAPLVRGPGSPSLIIAGAEMTQLNDGLREVLRVKGQGLFVVNVAQGTPAGESGLKSGDVIIRANRDALTSPAELVRLMRGSTEARLRLEIVRNSKQHSVLLRW